MKILSTQLPLAALALLLGLIGTGCTATKYKKIPAKSTVPPPVPINAVLGREPVAVTLHSVIIYKGPGSWKQEAYWDEYAFTLRNDTAETVTIDSTRLLDFAGAPRAAGVNPWALEAESKSLEKQYLESGIAFARYAGPVAVLGAVAVGAALTSVVGGGAGLAVAAVASEVLIPVYLVTVISLNTSRKHAIEHEFHQRRLLFPLVLKPGQERSGSLFFPMLPSPQALELAWHGPTGVGNDIARLPLPMLEGLHLEPAKKPTPPPSADNDVATKKST